MSGDIVFNGNSWIRASERMQGASDNFAAGSHEVTVARNISTGFLSFAKTDQAVRAGDEPMNLAWYERIGRAIEGLNSDASKMLATGENYQQMEEQGTAAAERFWS